MTISNYILHANIFMLCAIKRLKMVPQIVLMHKPMFPFLDLLTIMCSWNRYFNIWTYVFHIPLTIHVQP